MSSDAYDAIIIGAGIGGLVCGCYLAKAGMKVLICEQHYKPGGYCTSFKRKGFTFDAAADCFGAYRKDGITRKVFEELGIDKRLNIIRFDPPSIILTPDYRIPFWNDLEKTIKEFQTAFPEESNNIRNFFYFLSNSNPISFSKIRNWTFKNLLDFYFTNDRLKAVLSFPLLAIGGLPPSLMSAFMGAKFFSEFFLDGGYYPIGGMQALPDTLAKRFQEFGGELRLSSTVKKIRVKDKHVTGVVTEKDGFIPSKLVVSNCDARLTFLALIGKEKLKKNFCYKLKKMIPSISNFISYLALDHNFQFSQKAGSALFFFPHYNIYNAYLAMKNGDIESYGGHALRVSLNRSTMNIIVPVAYKNAMYWKRNKYKVLDLIINRVEKYSVPNLSQHIIYKEAATPYTLYRYTFNYKGASYGWEGRLSQFALSDFSKPSFIKNLYLTGHWTTFGVGISGVTYVGYNTAKLILRSRKENHRIL